jgi:hypothetical protein
MKKWILGTEKGAPVVARHDFQDLRSQLRAAGPEFRKAAALAQAEEKAKRWIEKAVVK